MNILYLILHTQKQSDRYYNIIDTWAKNQHYIFCSDHDDESSNVWKVSDNSDYNSGQEKQINTIKYLPIKLQNFDWYFFCDNDTFVNTKKLYEEIKNINPDEILCQSINTWPPDTTMYYPSGGAGFLISNKIMKFLHNNIEYNNVIWGDVSLGLNLKKYNISIKHSELLKSQPPEYYNISLDNIHKYISFHYIKDKIFMNDLYLRCIK